MTTSITGRMESALMNIRQIVYRRSRLIKKGVYPARDLVVMKSVKLGDSLKSMDFDRFHIVYVLDDDLHILGLLTESEIMDALAANCDDITFGQLLYARLADAQASARK
jgi:stage IV sporulation protein FB